MVNMPLMSYRVEVKLVNYIATLIILLNGSPTAIHIQTINKSCRYSKDKEERWVGPESGEWGDMSLRGLLFQ
jgi:hypothetical protein